MPLQHPNLPTILSFLKDRINKAPDIAVVLGSGLGMLADRIEPEFALPYSDIPGFVKTGIPGHKGQLIVGKLGEKRILLFSGRVHYYEGYDFSEVTLQVQTAHGLGAKTMLLSCSVGGINTEYRPGDFVFIKDHLNLQGNNPLFEMVRASGGISFHETPSPFVNLYGAYRTDIFESLKAEALRLQANLHLGVLCAVLGPLYETPAEAKMLRLLGADVVCMSTVPEVIMARYLGMDAAALAFVTNVHSDQVQSGPKHEEVLDVSKRGALPFIALMEKLASLLQ